MNTQAAQSDSISFDYDDIGHATIYQRMQQLLDSDAFKDWVLEKTVQGKSVLYSEEHALYTYVYEVTHGSPLRAFSLQPNDSGRFSVHARSLSSVGSPIITISGLSPGH